MLEPALQYGRTNERFAVKQPPLIAIGVLLVVIGFGIFGALMFNRPDPAEGTLPPRSGEPRDVAGNSGQPSRAWSIVAGLTLASGAACVGIGMNRWRSQPSTQGG